MNKKLEELENEMKAINTKLDLLDSQPAKILRELLDFLEQRIQDIVDSDMRNKQSDNPDPELDLMFHVGLDELKPVQSFIRSRVLRQVL